MTDLPQPAAPTFQPDALPEGVRPIGALEAALDDFDFDPPGAVPAMDRITEEYQQRSDRELSARVAAVPVTLTSPEQFSGPDEPITAEGLAAGLRTVEELTTFIPRRGEPTLADVAMQLGEFMGGVLPGLDAALAELGDGDWKDGTRSLVLRMVAQEVLEVFERDIDRAVSVDDLNGEAARHLANAVIARARALVELKRRA